MLFMGRRKDLSLCYGNARGEYVNSSTMSKTGALVYRTAVSNGAIIRGHCVYHDYPGIYRGSNTLQLGFVSEAQAM